MAWQSIAGRSRDGSTGWQHGSRSRAAGHGMAWQQVTGMLQIVPELASQAGHGMAAQDGSTAAGHGQQVTGWHGSRASQAGHGMAAQDGSTAAGHGMAWQQVTGMLQIVPEL
ncbi:hypothetical protein V6N13_060378 [Hibiscus sabdariffa]